MIHWFDWWVWTYDPRVTAVAGRSAWIPMELFPRQREFLLWLEARVAKTEDGLAEKSRDVGFGWLTAGFAIHRWLFQPGFKTSFGSRKEIYVDRRGDPDCIFEKLRMIVMYLPRFMWPENFSSAYDNHMRLLNPANGNTIGGEAGPEMGRGGRSSLYIIDEAAFIERADDVDKATSANSETRIWGSSVNGMGNLFARKRFGGQLRPDQIFRLHWRDDPRKNPEWATKKRATLEDWKWASEYEIDYSASVEGIAIPAKWIEASLVLSAMLIEGKIKYDPPARGIGGLDVGAGKAKSVFIARFGALVTPPLSWGDPDTIETANRALDCASTTKVKREKREGVVTTLNYDSPGVGAGVQSALRSNRTTVRCNPINTGSPPSAAKWPDGESSTDKFVNLRAEAWWRVRARLKCAYELWLHLTKQQAGQNHPISDCLLLPVLSSGPDAQVLAGQLSLPKWHRNEKGKILIESKRDMTARDLQSPDHADALVLTECQEAVVDYETLSKW